MTEIVEVKAREILDSRGNPTVEVDVHLACGAMGRAAVPSGRVDRHARGPRAARQATPSATAARACATAVDNVIRRDRAGGLRPGRRRPGARSTSAMIDLDGTANKSKLGANAILGVSMAAARAAADGVRPAALPLPRRLSRPRPADPHDEHHQRRRACRQHPRLPGVHDHPLRRRRPSPRRVQMGAETFHCAEGHSARSTA
ncbi:MAG: hypothetical protein MZV70_50850 [Desulfobacterales bacterium]|nr:hypothetical protein [Desulfobacterales bacterium]